MSEKPYSARLSCGSRVLDLSRPHVMGILNVTPDSFSDGGQHAGVDAALRHAAAMVTAGATLIDVGGESTRPGAGIVSPMEELERVAVIRETARLGAGLINDVRSLSRDGALDAAAYSGLPVCLMHMRGEPGDMQNDPRYDDVTSEVVSFLRGRMELCLAAGIPDDRIVLDPGFGFAKTLSHNLHLFNRLEQLHVLGRPLLVGVSRKSMVGQVLQRDVAHRLYGSLALAALAVVKGAGILRVHDVAETVDVIRMIAAVQAAE